MKLYGVFDREPDTKGRTHFELINIFFHKQHAETFVKEFYYNARDLHDLYIRDVWTADEAPKAEEKLQKLTDFLNNLLREDFTENGLTLFEREIRLMKAEKGWQENIAKNAKNVPKSNTNTKS